MEAVLEEWLQHSFMQLVRDVHCTLFDLVLKSSDSMFTSAKIRNGSTYLENHVSARLCPG